VDLGGFDGRRYQERFDALADQGVDVHGEANFVLGLGPHSVLDAGCGTGRVAIELARRGLEVVGVDREESMVQEARRRAPALEWVVADLVGLDLGRLFDAVVMAGNVPLFTAPGTQADLVAACARHLRPGGHLVAGFQVDRSYALSSYDSHCEACGLEPLQRWSTWDRQPYRPGSGYAVSVHFLRHGSD